MRYHYATLPFESGRRWWSRTTAFWSQARRATAILISDCCFICKSSIRDIWTRNLSRLLSRLAAPGGLEPRISRLRIGRTHRLYEGAVWYSRPDSNRCVRAENPANLTAIRREHWDDGRQGRTRTCGVSDVAALQAAAFASRRHLTIKWLARLDSNRQPPH